MARRERVARLLPIEVVSSRVRKLDQDQIDAMMNGLQTCLSLLRSGNGLLEHVMEFDCATKLAQLIERQGVVKGLKQSIDDADRAILTMRLRADKTNETIGPLYGPEIAALEHLIVVHRFQLEQLSQGEYEDVLRRMAGQGSGKL